MSWTNNQDTPRTNEVDKKARKLDGEDYYPGEMREHARRLERELTEMTKRYIAEMHKVEERIAANESAMKTCASLAAENDRLRGDLEAALNSYHAANNERLTLKGVTAETKHPNVRLSEPGANT